MMRALLLSSALLFAPLLHAETAPSFKVAGVSGPVELAQLRGKVVYVDFWASWCTPCRKSFPWLNDMAARYGQKGLVVVGINLDKEKAAAQAFLKETPAKFTVGFDPDGKTADDFQVKGMPSSFLIDRKGNIINKHMGFRDQDKAALEKKIKDALDNAS